MNTPDVTIRITEYCTTIRKNISTLNCIDVSFVK